MSGLENRGRTPDLKQRVVTTGIEALSWLFCTSIYIKKFSPPVIVSISDFEAAFNRTPTEELKPGIHNGSNGAKNNTIVEVREKKGRTTAKVKTVPAASFKNFSTTYYLYTRGQSFKVPLNKPVDITLNNRLAHVVAEPVDNPVPGVMEAKIFSIIWHKYEGEPPEG